MNCVLIKMGGRGTRFGADKPKQYCELKGEPFFVHVLRRYMMVDSIDKFIIVSNPNWYDYTLSECKLILQSKLMGVVKGGDTNLKSTFNGINMASEYLEPDDILLIHDITDPVIKSEAINGVIESAKKNGCAAVITEQVHTLYKIAPNGEINGTIPKHSIGSGYSPEAFKYSLLKYCFDKATENDLNNMTSALSVVISNGYKPQYVVSHQLDIKLTFDVDMHDLESIL